MSTCQAIDKSGLDLGGAFGLRSEPGRIGPVLVAACVAYDLCWLRLALRAGSHVTCVGCCQPQFQRAELGFRMGSGNLHKAVFANEGALASMHSSVKLK